MRTFVSSFSQRLKVIALAGVIGTLTVSVLITLCLNSFATAAESFAVLLLQPRTAPADGAAQEALLKALSEALKTKLRCELVPFTPVLPGIQLAIRDGRITHREVSSPHKNVQALLKCMGMQVGMWVRAANIDASAKSMANRITGIEVTIVTVNANTTSEFIDVEKARAEELAAQGDERKRSERKVKSKVESMPSMQLFVNAIARRLKAALDASSLNEGATLPSEEDEFAQLVVRARKLAKDGNLEEAAGLYRKLTMLSPGVASLYVELGEVYERMKRFNDALIEYERATRVDQKNVDAWRKLAELQYNLGRVEEAWRSVQELISLSPNSAAHLLLAARIARLRSTRVGRIDGTVAIEMRNIARHYYQQALELEPNEEVAVEAAEFIEAQRTSGKRGAVELLRSFLSRAKGDKPPIKALSMCLRLLIQMNQLDEAYGIFKEALGDEPKEELLRQMPYELVGEVFDARWAQVYNQVVSLLDTFGRRLISREDALEELSWLSSDAERIAAMARKLEPSREMKQLHDKRLLCYDLFSQAIVVAKLYIDTGDPIHQRRAYLLMQNAYAEWKALHGK